MEWVYLGDVQFIDPFFNETIVECKFQNSYSSDGIGCRLTSLEFLIEVAEKLDFVDPSLFIFHTSRCGSTLITQLLSLDEANIVVSEYALIDLLFRINEDKEVVPASIRKQLIQSVFSVIGQKRNSRQQRLIVKLDSWHSYYYDELKALFPTAQKAFMFREPDSILNSIERKPGIQFVPTIIAPAYFNLREEDLPLYAVTGYANLVLEKMYQSAEELALKDDELLLLDYDEGMEYNFNLVIKLLAIPGDFATEDRVKQRLNYHSKEPSVNFIKDEPARHKSTSKATLEAYFHLKQFTIGRSV